MLPENTGNINYRCQCYFCIYITTFHIFLVKCLLFLSLLFEILDQHHGSALHVVLKPLVWHIYVLYQLLFNSFLFFLFFPNYFSHVLPMLKTLYLRGNRNMTQTN